MFVREKILWRKDKMWLFFSCIGSDIQEQQTVATEQFSTYISKNMLRAKAQHILIAHSDAQFSDKTLKRGEKDAINRAKDVLEQLKNGKAFEKLAIRYSDDPNRNQGGVLAAFGKDEMDENFLLRRESC